jgi:hypothetical protein
MHALTACGGEGNTLHVDATVEIDGYTLNVCTAGIEEEYTVSLDVIFHGLFITSIPKLFPC